MSIVRSKIRRSRNSLHRENGEDEKNEAVVDTREGWSDGSSTACQRCGSRNRFRDFEAGIRPRARRTNIYAPRLLRERCARVGSFTVHRLTRATSTSPNRLINSSPSAISYHRRISRAWSQVSSSLCRRFVISNERFSIIFRIVMMFFGEGYCKYCREWKKYLIVCWDN